MHYMYKIIMYKHRGSDGRLKKIMFSIIGKPSREKINILKKHIKAVRISNIRKTMFQILDCLADNAILIKIHMYDVCMRQPV